jgi:hypothetical protein
MIASFSQVDHRASNDTPIITGRAIISSLYAVAFSPLTGLLHSKDAPAPAIKPYNLVAH